MIYEYAVDPGLLPIWAQKKQYDFWKKQFELGERRVVTAVSTKRKWKELARPLLRSGALNGGVDTARLGELFKMLSGDGDGFPVVERSDSSYDGTLGWLENALVEHGRAPLTGVLTHREDRAEPHIIDAKDYAVDHEHWNLPEVEPVARSADAFAEALGPMLRAASKVVFIDPYLDFDDDRYSRSTRALLAQFLAGPVTPTEVLFITGPRCVEVPKVPTWLRRARKGLRPVAPELPSHSVAGRIQVIRQRPGGQKLHDRFVLTDIGGVQFTIGLDAGGHGGSDSCLLLPKAHWQHAWRDYVECKGFELVEEWQW